MNGIGKYQETAVLTQDRGKIVVMLYDGAIKFLNLAIVAIEQKNWQAKSEYINKATNIIVELNTVLDMEHGGEIAENLRKIYNFTLAHLGRAGAQSDILMIREVIKILEELNQGWKAIA